MVENILIGTGTILSASVIGYVVYGIKLVRQYGTPETEHFGKGLDSSRKVLNDGNPHVYWRHTIERVGFGLFIAVSMFFIISFLYAIGEGVTQAATLLP